MVFCAVRWEVHGAWYVEAGYGEVEWKWKWKSGEGSRESQGERRRGRGECFDTVILDSILDCLRRLRVSS